MSDGQEPLRLDEVPSVAALTSDQKSWLVSALIECGFEMVGNSRVRASVDTLDALRREQNEARKQVHADAALKREALLDSAVRSLASTDAALPKPAIAAARSALGDFLAAFDGQPAVGPVLLGAAALLKEQAASGGSGRCWRVERAALLNGGDAFVSRVVPLLGSLGLRCAVADLEAGDAVTAEEISLEVAPGAWAAGEMEALASLLQRRCRRMPIAARANGRVDLSARAYEARPIASWHDWLGTLFTSFLCRFG